MEGVSGHVFFGFFDAILAYCPALVNFVRNFLQNLVVTKFLGIKLFPTSLYSVISKRVANSWGTTAFLALNLEILQLKQVFKYI